MFFVLLAPTLALRVTTIPRVAAVPPIPLDWDLVIRDGEALLAGTRERGRAYYQLPLAAAYHQRACRTWAEGDRKAALPDAERAAALDPEWLQYEPTRALALEAARTRRPRSRPRRTTPCTASGSRSCSSEIERDRADFGHPSWRGASRGRY